MANEWETQRNAWETWRLEKIKQSGANAYWDDIPFHENPFGYSGGGAQRGLKLECQAWANGWNQSDRELCNGVKNAKKANKTS